MNLRTQRADVKIIISLTLVHFIGDVYHSFVVPLLPLFVSKFSLTLAQTGMITGISRFFAFVVQPPVGYLADRYRTRFFSLGGPLLVILFIALTGIAPSFWILILFVSIGSIGSSMLHPTTAGMIEPYAGRHFGLAMSIFGTGGTLAFAVGPIFVAWYVSMFGLEALPYTMMPGLAVLIFLYLTVPVPAGEGLQNRSLLGSIREILGPVWLPVFSIWLVMTLQSFVVQSFFTFLPVMYAQQQFSLLFIGTIISLFTVAGALSGLLAGHLSDRFGFKPIFIGSNLLTAPSLYLLLKLPGSWVYAGAFLAGFSALATLPLGVAAAQRLAPRGKSMASSLMMGLAYGTGGLLTPLTGKLADMYSLEPVLSLLAALPLLSIIIIYYYLPKNI